RFWAAGGPLDGHRDGPTAVSGARFPGSPSRPNNAGQGDSEACSEFFETVRSAVPGEPVREVLPRRRPVVVGHRVLDGRAPRAVAPDPVLAQFALTRRAEPLDGRLRALVVDVGVPDDARAA